MNNQKEKEKKKKEKRKKALKWKLEIWLFDSEKSTPPFYIKDQGFHKKYIALRKTNETIFSQHLILRSNQFNALEFSHGKK